MPTVSSLKPDSGVSWAGLTLYVKPHGIASLLGVHGGHMHKHWAEDSVTPRELSHSATMAMPPQTLSLGKSRSRPHWEAGS